MANGKKQKFLVKLESMRGQNGFLIGTRNLGDIPSSAELEPMSSITVTATRSDGSQIKFDAVVRLDTPVEVEYYRNGGILPAVLRNLAEA